MNPAFRDVEVDAVEGDDLTEGLADPAGTDRKRERWPAGAPAGRRVVTLVGCCPNARQLVSELGM
jgi:hypothetical protein